MISRHSIQHLGLYNLRIYALLVLFNKPWMLMLRPPSARNCGLNYKPFQVEPGWVRLCSSLGMGFAALSNSQVLLAFFSITHYTTCSLYYRLLVCCWIQFSC